MAPDSKKLPVVWLLGIFLFLCHLHKHSLTPDMPDVASIANTAVTRHKAHFPAEIKQKVTQLINRNCDKCHKEKVQDPVLRKVYSRRT